MEHFYRKKSNRPYMFEKKRVTPMDTRNHGYVYEQERALSLWEKLGICLLRGGLVFCITLGTIGGVISSFSIECNLFLIILLLLVLSMVTALLRMQRVLFYMGYPLLFILFVRGIMQSYRLVNYGFQSFLSSLQAAYSDYFHLSMVREVEKTNLDSVTATTYAAIYMGFFLILLFHMLIAEYMSLGAVIGLSFLIFQLGIYIGKYPALPYLFLLLTGYVFIAFWKYNGHYQIPLKKTEQTRYRMQKRDGVIVYQYRVSGGKLLSGFKVLVPILFLLLVALLTTQSYDTWHKKPNHILRASIDAKLKVITQNGIFGLLDRYEATGGLSGGKLGGVSSVRPDYETDLEVTYVPYSTENVYLKGYTGTYYTGSSWEAYYPKAQSIGPHYGLNDSLQMGKKLYQKSYLSGQMQINNLDANTDYLYIPYYPTALKDCVYKNNQGILMGNSRINEPYLIQYTPVMPSLGVTGNGNRREHYSRKEQDRIQDYSEFENLYLSVPLEIEQELKDIKEEIGYASTISGQILLIQNYFAKNYTYTMSPGTTPYKQDYVVHFLKHQKRGYCAHFASAATMLLRSYGICARYVEGYCFSPLQAAGVAINEDAKDWFWGEGELEQPQVVTFEINDGDAHAWVEVYYEDIGWIPFEFTLGEVEEESISTEGFWSLFDNWVRGNGTNGTLEKVDFQAGNTSALTALEISKTVLLAILTCLLIGISLVGLGVFAQKSYVHGKRLCKYKKGEYEEYLLWQYERVKRKNPEYHKTHPEIYELLQKCCYSQKGINRTEADRILQACRKEAKGRKK